MQICIALAGARRVWGAICKYLVQSPKKEKKEKMTIHTIVVKQHIQKWIYIKLVDMTCTCDAS